MTDKEGDGMAAQYAAELRHENALRYADRVVASPETFHEDEVLLAGAVKTLRGRIKQWKDDYYRMNSMHEYEEARATKLEGLLRRYAVVETERSDSADIQGCKICGEWQFPNPDDDWRETFPHALLCLLRREATTTSKDSTSPATSPQSAATAAIGPPTNTSPTPVSADARSHEAPTKEE